MNPMSLDRVDLPSAGLPKHIVNFHHVNLHLERIISSQIFKNESRSCPAQFKTLPWNITESSEIDPNTLGNVDCVNGDISNELKKDGIPYWE